MKQTLFAYVNHAWIRSWNQPVLSNEGKVSCSRKQQEPLLGLDLTTDRHPSTLIQTGSYYLHWTLKQKRTLFQYCTFISILLFAPQHYKQLLNINIKLSSQICILNLQLEQSCVAQKEYILSKGWKLKRSKCYWIKKQIKHFHIHPSI